MINTLALHKLKKFSHSKMLLIFALAGFFIGLITFMPAIIAKAVVSAVPGGEGMAASFFNVIETFGALVAVSLGALLWRQDEKDGTILTFLARPVSRVEMLVSKLIGSIYALLMFLGTSLVIYFIAHLLLFPFSIPAIFFAYLFQVIIKWIAFLSFGLLFSCFFNSFLAATLVVGYFFVGIIGGILINIPYHTTEVIAKIFKFLVMDTDRGLELDQLLMSDLDSLTPLYIGIAYYALWALMLFCASIIKFSRREFSSRQS